MKEGFPEQVESKSDVNEVSGISDLQKKNRKSDNIWIWIQTLSQAYLPIRTSHFLWDEWSYAEQQQQQQPFYSPLSGTTRVSRYKKKHSPTHHP